MLPGDVDMVPYASVRVKCKALWTVSWTGYRVIYDDNYIFYRECVFDPLLNSRPMISTIRHIPISTNTDVCTFLNGYGTATSSGLTSIAV